jgi:hypothetical protein
MDPYLFKTLNLLHFHALSSFSIPSTALKKMSIFIYTDENNHAVTLFPNNGFQGPDYEAEYYAEQVAKILLPNGKELFENGDTNCFLIMKPEGAGDTWPKETVTLYAHVSMLSVSPV